MALNLTWLYLICFQGRKSEREIQEKNFSKARLEGEHLPQPAGGMFCTSTGKDSGSKVDIF